MVVCVPLVRWQWDFVSDMSRIAWSREGDYKDTCGLKAALVHVQIPTGLHTQITAAFAPYISINLPSWIKDSAHIGHKISACNAAAAAWRRRRRRLSAGGGGATTATATLECSQVQPMSQSSPHLLPCWWKWRNTQATQMLKASQKIPLSDFNHIVVLGFCKLWRHIAEKYSCFW